MRRRPRTSPLAAAGSGLLAGMAGTALMTGYQLAVARLRGSEGSSSAPAEVGKRATEGVAKRPVPESWTGPLNYAVHFAYGTSWGLPYGLVHSSRDSGALRDGIALGAAAWGASLVELPLLKLAPPVWEYPPEEAALDLSYHLVFGVGVAAAFAALRR